MMGSGVIFIFHVFWLHWLTQFHCTNSFPLGVAYAPLMHTAVKWMVFPTFSSTQISASRGALFSSIWSWTAENELKDALFQIRFCCSTQPSVEVIDYSVHYPIVTSCPCIQESLMIMWYDAGQPAAYTKGWVEHKRHNQLTPRLNLWYTTPFKK